MQNSSLKKYAQNPEPFQGQNGSKAEAGKIIDTEASDKEKDDTDNNKGDSFYMFFHRASSLSSNLVILSDQTVRTAMQALHL